VVDEGGGEREAGRCVVGFSVVWVGNIQVLPNESTNFCEEGPSGKGQKCGKLNRRKGR